MFFFAQTTKSYSEERTSCHFFHLILFASDVLFFCVRFMLDFPLHSLVVCCRLRQFGFDGWNSSWQEAAELHSRTDRHRRGLRRRHVHCDGGAPMLTFPQVDLWCRIGPFRVLEKNCEPFVSDVLRTHEKWKCFDGSWTGKRLCQLEWTYDVQYEAAQVSSCQTHKQVFSVQNCSANFTANFSAFFFQFLLISPPN